MLHRNTILTTALTTAALAGSAKADWTALIPTIVDDRDTALASCTNGSGVSVVEVTNGDPYGTGYAEAISPFCEIRVQGSVSGYYEKEFIFTPSDSQCPQEGRAYAKADAHIEAEATTHWGNGAASAAGYVRVESNVFDEALQLVTTEAAVETTKSYLGTVGIKVPLVNAEGEVTLALSIATGHTPRSESLNGGKSGLKCLNYFSFQHSGKAQIEAYALWGFVNPGKAWSEMSGWSTVDYTLDVCPGSGSDCDEPTPGTTDE